MIVEDHQDLTNPQRRKASRVVIYDEQNNPVAVFVQVQPDHLFCSVVGQEGFLEALKAAGIHKTTLVTKV